jgi:hypothetical protein
MNAQIKEQQDFVARIGQCTCLVYHPVGDEYQRVFIEWVKTGKSNMVMVAQLFGDCNTREK